MAAVLSTRGEPRRSELALLGPGAPRPALFAGPGRFSGVVPSPDGGGSLLAWKAPTSGSSSISGIRSGSSP